MQEKHIGRAFCKTHLILRSLGCISLCLLISCSVASAKDCQDSLIRVGVDFAYFGSSHKLTQDIQLSVCHKLSGTLRFACYRYTASADSICVYSQKDLRFKTSEGARVCSFRFGANGSNSFVHPQFYNILRSCGTVPAGSYRIHVTIATDSGASVSRVFQLQSDSALPPTSPLSRSLSSILAHGPDKQKGIFAKLAGTASGTASKAPAAKVLERSTGHMARLFKSRGLTPQTEQRGDKSYVNLWYEDWFVGRYELEANQSAAAQISRQQSRLSGNISSFAGTELGSYRSLFSQVRELSKANKQDKDLRGELGISGNFSNAQPEYSAQDNNYYEIRGRAETEVADIPISMEGYYTTQDAHRLVKGSYIRVHYDADRGKEKLMRLISGYRNQFSQTVSKGKGLEQVYGSYLSNLEGSKDRMSADMLREAGLPIGSIRNVSGSAGNAAAGGAGTINSDALKAQIEAALAKKMQDTSSLAGSAEGKLDSAGKARAAVAKAKASGQKAALIKDSANRLYNRAMKKQEQIQKTEAQIEKYQALLAQYKNTAYFDSALAYSKVANLKGGEETTYKQMAKSASGLLPEGKAKTFIAGLTNLDAGIFSKYTSKYTAAGQQLTGLDVGYDVGFAQIGMTVGKTEYAGRDGGLDKYTTYSGRMLFSPAKGQKAGLVYYGYTPSKSMLRDNDFFSNADIALPTFRSPVHIVSATYEGTVTKEVSLEGEIATSFRNGSDQKFSGSFDADRIAWHLNGEGRIPRTPLTLTGGYEHGGKNFQNSTLPVGIAGTDLYKAGIKGAFFHDFLTAGIEFNRMQQQNLYAAGGNNRWGFEVATHSRQYPSVSLSYKPFATFRSYTDTLAVPQRPLQGAVWTGKATYQIKRPGGVSYRFSAVLNRSASHSDSVSYGADLLQLNVIYTDKVWTLMFSAGQSIMITNSGGYGVDTLNPAHVRTTFVTGSLGYAFSKTTSVSGGADIGFAPFGLSKLGLNGGLSYRMKAAPLTVRISTRYSSYRLAGYSGAVGRDSGSGNGNAATEPMSWRQLVSGSIELIWQFRMKVNG